MLRYLLDHPEYDDPQATGTLTFFIAQQASTGKSVVAVRFTANPEIFRVAPDCPRLAAADWG